MHSLTLLFAAGLISSITAAPLPAARDALLDFQERSGSGDDESFDMVSRSLDALDQDLEERGIGGSKPFRPDDKPNKLQKDKPIPKTPNPQPKTANVLTKDRPSGHKNIAKNYRRGSGGSKPFRPDDKPNKLQKDKPIPKTPNPQPKTANVLTKDRPAGHKNVSKNFRRGDPKPFRPDDKPKKLQKQQPTPKKPNPQPKTANVLTKERPTGHKNISKNFRRGSEDELEERDDEWLEERDDEWLEERDDEWLEERDDEWLEERDDEWLEERDDDLEERDDDFLVERWAEWLEERGIGGSKPFRPDDKPNKLQKDKPIPKTPNPQPKTANVLTKDRPSGHKNVAKNF